MKRPQLTALAFALGMGASLGLSLAQEPSPPAQLGHGFNLGCALEAPHGEGEWGVTLQDGYFAAIRQAGFDTLRIPVGWSYHLGPAPDYKIDPAFLARVDWAVAEAKKYGFIAVLDNHGDPEIREEPDKYTERFLTVWRQIATHYKDEPPSLYFELLNEPDDKLDTAHWNALLARGLAAVRETNPERKVVIGPVEWNSINKIFDLVLPENDPNLIVTVHFYEPTQFTHQGASWMPGSDAWMGTKWMGTEPDRRPILWQFDRAQKWGAEHHRPIYLGEFGAFEKGDMDSRARWVSTVASEATRRGFSWTYWEFCSSFGAYDPVALQWREPLLKALQPGSP